MKTYQKLARGIETCNIGSQLANIHFVKYQGRSQTFTTDEASVARAKGESFLGPGSGGMPRENFLKLLSLKSYFQHFFMGFFIKIQTCISVKRPDLLVLLTFVIPTIRPCNGGTK